METENKFLQLLSLNVNDKTEKKKGDGKTELTYLSWAWAWAEFKKIYPDATYTIERFENGLPYVYDAETGYMVFTSVSAGGITHEMWLPVMNGANKAMKAQPYTYTVKGWGDKPVEKRVEAATMFDINKTLMRCFVKNLAMFGLGLYIYAGEDLPEDADGSDGAPQKKQGRLFTEEEAAAAKKWADNFGLTAYEDACGQMGVADLTECEYARRAEFMAIVRERARAAKGEDN